MGRSVGERHRKRRSEREIAPHRLPATTRLSAWLAAWLLRFVDWTSRNTVLMPENDLYLKGIRAIYIAFHQGIVFNSIQAKNRGILVMISRSSDGDLATRALYPLGIGRSRTGNHEAAIEALRTHLAREPDLWRSYVVLADAYRLAGRLQDAESLYRLAVGRFPSTREVHWRWVLFLEQEERIAEALAACDELQRVSPGEPARALADRLTRKAAIGSR